MSRPSTDRVTKHRYRRQAAADEARRQAAEAEANRAFTPDQSQDIERWKYHPGAFIEENLWVPHIDGGKMVPFDLNPGQRKVVQAIEEIKAKGEPVRLIVLKSRKQGISTLCQGVGYGFVSTRAYVNGLILLDTKDKAGKILDLSRKFHMNDERRAMGLRPLLEASNRLELKFGNPDARTREIHPGLQSRLEISSADSKDPGRSGTYHFIHASEVAFWEDDSVWASAGNALMWAEDTIAIMESTGNGCAGLFYDTWEAAVAGKSSWKPVFLSWLDDPRCARPLTRQERDTWEWLSQEEREYAEKYHLTMEQAKFRRQVLHDPASRKAGKESVDVFNEEYPADPELAFTSGGRTFFLARTLEALEKHPEKGKKPPLFRGRMHNRTPLESRTPGNVKACPIDVVLEPDPYGPLRIWEHPQKDCEYVLGGDVAEGLAHSDNHCVVVMKRHNRQIVAVWKCHDVTSRVAGQSACLLGWYYAAGHQQPPLVGIELNAHGIAATQEAARIMYPNLWHHTDVRKEGAEPQERIGWLTTEGVRTYMLECIEFEIQAAAMEIPSEEFYQEARTFENIDGKPQARQGKKDDEIMATAITLQMHIHSGPPRRLPEGTKKKDEPRKLEPDYPIQGQVPIRPPRALRKIGGGGLWGE